ncbi:MAG TPA: extracellular solute-binding protein [Armatimonadota bacterium]|jgi:multiple sugar transport system permease protein
MLNKALSTLVALGATLCALIAPVRANVTISYMGWGAPPEVRITKDLLKTFHDKHPEIDVKYILAPQFDDKLRTMLAGDIPPDVFYMSVENFPIYSQKQVLLNLDPYIKASKFDTSDFFPRLINGFRDKGHLYGLPKDFTTQVLFFNKDLFDRDQIAYPTDKWTWEDMRDAAKKLTHDFDGDGRIDQYGLQYIGGTMMQYCWYRQAGARMFTPDGKRFALNSPDGVRALQFLHDLDYKDHVALTTSAAAGRDAQAEFSNGHLGMFIGYGRWLVPRFREMNKFRWDCAVMPHDKERFSVIATVAYSIAARSKHPKEAWELVKFLTGPEGQAQNSRLGLAIPALKSVAYGPAFLTPGSTINDHAFLDSIPYAEIAPRTANPDEYNQILDPVWEQVLTLNKVPPAKALANLEPQVNAFLLKYRTLKAFPLVPWSRVLGVLAVLGSLIVAGIVVFFQRSGPIGKLARWEERIGYLFISPWIIGLLIFSLFPIVTSMLMSLCQWDAITPIHHAQWVGLDNYHRLFTQEPKFWMALRVTAIYSVFSVPIGLVLSVAIAILLNQKVKGIPVFRTIYYVPSLVGGVSVAVLWWRIFNRDFGILNFALDKMGIFASMGIKPIDWLGSETFALPALIIMSMWGVGGGMLIYLAGLQGIPTQLYEAASIDGAGNFRKFWTITLPMLSPVIFFNLIMGIIGSFQVFTQAYVMTSGGPNNATLFYVLYLFQKGFQQFQMGYASALAWVLFAIVLALTALVMRSSKSWVHYEGSRE